MKMNIIYLAIIFVSLIFAIHGVCQTAGVTNISLTNNQLGFMPEDMIYANGKLFIYSTGGIAVYNESPLTFIDTIQLPPSKLVGQANMDIDHLIENRTGYSTMAFDGVNTIYAVAPDYSVWSIAVDNYVYSKVIEPFYTGYFAGSVLLLFEPNTQWLFYSCQGPQEQATDGLPQFFAIYDTDTQPFQQIFQLQPENPPRDVYDIYIDYKTPLSSYFYLSRKLKLEVWEFSHDGNNIVSQKTLIETGNQAKHGRLIKMHDNHGMDKIICLPLQNRNENDAHLYVIDAEDPAQHHYIDEEDLPARKILDAEYDENQGKLLFAIKPDNLVGNDPDFRIYSASLDGNDHLVLNHYQDINTDSFFPDDTSNFPNNIHKLNTSSYLISKKSEICKIEYNTENQDYELTSLDDQQNNYFERSVSGTGSSVAYVLRPMGGGITKIAPLSYPVNTYMGQFLNKGLYNENNNMVYAYGEKLIFPYTVFMINADDYGVTHHELDMPFGDMILNPASSEIIVSRYDDQQGMIRVYDEDFLGFQDYNTETGTSFCGDMFLDPNGFLYVTTGMKAGLTQSVSIFNTNDNYSFAGSYNLVPSFPAAASETDPPDELIARFLYNPYDASYPVYFYITHHTSPYLSPYIINRKTYFFRINHDGAYDNIANLTQMCYDFVLTDDNDLYIALDDELKALQCNNFFNIITISTDQILDLEYDSFERKVYGLTRGAELQRIKAIDTDTYSISEIAELNAEVSNIHFLNPSRHIIAYSHIDRSESVPGENVKAYYIDVEDSYAIEERTIGLKSMDRFNRSNNLEFEMIYDPEHHKIFIPQGGQSKVCVLQDIPIDTLSLAPGWTWLSFPRLVDNPSNPTPPNVLHQAFFNSGYESLLMTYLEVSGPNEDLTSVTWDKVYEWQYQNLNNIYSIRGYKLYLDPEEKRKISLFGEILDASTPMTLYENKDNWMGYFLTFPQDPFDAIPISVLDNLDYMWGQHWSCYNDNPYPDGTGGLWRCACNEGKIELDYGDMVILHSRVEQPLVWNQNGNGVQGDDKEAAEFFTFEEQAQYDPIYVEIDTINIPEEIAAFAGDSCIGATKVLPGDTTVLICGYTEGFEGEEITFEQYYATKSSRPAVDDYLVLNTQTGIKEKRRIIAGENQPYFLVSFRTEAGQTENDTPLRIKCYPNPAGSEVVISYFNPNTQNVKVQLLNLLGREIQQFEFGQQSPGNYEFTLNPSGLQPGGYLVRLTTGNRLISTKLLIME